MDGVRGGRIVRQRFASVSSPVEYSTHNNQRAALSCLTFEREPFKIRADCFAAALAEPGRLQMILRFWSMTVCGL